MNLESLYTSFQETFTTNYGEIENVIFPRNLSKIDNVKFLHDSMINFFLEPTRSIEILKKSDCLDDFICLILVAMKKFNVNYKAFNKYKKFN